MELQKILGTLKEHMTFKPTTEPGDVILVGMPSGLFYGIVRSIDNNIKKDWFNLSFNLLVIPPAEVTWILRVPQMTGEFFTINGEDHFVIAVDATKLPKKKPGAEISMEKKLKKRTLTLVKDDAEEK
ncbi:MAG: hypothetical protein WCQ99_09065 [Pseudomonadota bacterium]